MTSLLRQRTDGDCGVVALSLFAEVPYERAWRAVVAVIGKDEGLYGLTNGELLAAAQRLDVRLTATRRYDLELDEGILRVRFGKKDQTGHWVAVRNGLILCPTDGLAVAYEEYFDRYNGRPCTLLRGTA